MKNIFDLSELSKEDLKELIFEAKQRLTFEDYLGSDVLNWIKDSCDRVSFGESDVLVGGIHYFEFYTSENEKSIARKFLSAFKSNDLYSGMKLVGNSVFYRSETERSRYEIVFLDIEDLEVKNH